MDDSSFRPIEEAEIRLLPGDYVRYYDGGGAMVGSGVLLKAWEEEGGSLVYLLKNMRTGVLKRVPRDRYRIYFKRHTAKNSSTLGRYLREMVKKE